jgi:hypothetical protein
VLSYRVVLDVPLQLASFLAELLADHRRDIGTRHGTRGLPAAYASRRARISAPRTMAMAA